MKEQKENLNKNFLKKFFIKICRIFGYEIIDQSNLYVPTQEKNLGENLNIQGKKSINLPLGEVKITRKVNSLTVIFRSCTSVNMLTQNKKRLFDKNKSEYTFSWESETTDRGVINLLAFFVSIVFTWAFFFFKSLIISKLLYAAIPPQIINNIFLFLNIFMWN